MPVYKPHTIKKKRLRWSSQGEVTYFNSLWKYLIPFKKKHQILLRRVIHHKKNMCINLLVASNNKIKRHVTLFFQKNYLDHLVTTINLVPFQCVVEENFHRQPLTLRLWEYLLRSGREGGGRDFCLAVIRWFGSHFPYEGLVHPILLSMCS